MIETILTMLIVLAILCSLISLWATVVCVGERWSIGAICFAVTFLALSTLCVLSIIVRDDIVDGRAIIVYPSEYEKLDAPITEVYNV